MAFPLPLFDHSNSPTYEELFDQNYKLFEDLDQELESSRAHSNVPDSPKGNHYVPSYAAVLLNCAVECSITPEPTRLTSPTHEELSDNNYNLFEDSDQESESSRADSNVADSPKGNHYVFSYAAALLNCAGECFVMPEPTHLTTGMQANPPSVEKAPKKRKRKNYGWARRKKTRKTVITVSDHDENDDEARSEVEGPQTGQFIGESSSSVHHTTREQVTPWESLLRTPTRVFRTPLNAASEVAPSFAEHLG